MASGSRRTVAPYDRPALGSWCSAEAEGPNLVRIQKEEALASLALHPRRRTPRSFASPAAGCRGAPGGTARGRHERRRGSIAEAAEG